MEKQRLIDIYSINIVNENISCKEWIVYNTISWNTNNTITNFKLWFRQIRQKVYAVTAQLPVVSIKVV